MRILLDESLPIELRDELPGHLNQRSHLCRNERSSRSAAEMAIDATMSRHE